MPSGLEIAMHMHGEDALREAIADVASVDLLSAEFPTVPDRILASVLGAYRSQGISGEEALRMAMRRLRDAIAIETQAPE